MPNIHYIDVKSNEQRQQAGHLCTDIIISQRDFPDLSYNDMFIW